MPSYLMPGLSQTAASHICMNQCRAMCCRGPLLLELTAAELPRFTDQAAALGVQLRVNRGNDGNGWLKFADHPGERCPMLDPATYQCRIYQQRPQRCRDFPEKLTPGCPISGG